MEHAHHRIICATVAKAPEWIRVELASKDAAARLRAEEALAAIIASALADAEASD
jgi:hypothetical protein